MSYAAESLTPSFGDPIDPSFASADARRLLALRRSGSVDRMAAPGPDASTLERILTIAARVPDHRKMVPFRFIVFEGAGRARAGEVLARTLAANQPEADLARLEVERRRFERAPVVIGVVSRVDPAHKTPEWEQVLCAGAVCLNLLLAASAHGFAGVWLTDWCAYDRQVQEAFGCGPAERMAGYIHLGTATGPSPERVRPEMTAIVTKF